MSEQRAIAVCGKGGVGKTAFTAMLTKVLMNEVPGKLLVVDADPALGLNYAIGRESEVTIGSIREILGSGTWFGLPVTINLFDPISIFVLAPGGFLVFGCVIALLNKLTNGKGVKRKSFDCASCPNASGCSNAGKGGCE